MLAFGNVHFRKIKIDPLMCPKGLGIQRLINMKSRSPFENFSPLRVFTVREFEANPLMYPCGCNIQKLAKKNYCILQYKTNG